MRRRRRVNIKVGRFFTTYEDAYTSELKDLHACLTEGKVIKTSIEDAIEHLQIFQMILKCAFPLKA
jgi:hypothetical protein